MSEPRVPSRSEMREFHLHSMRETRESIASGTHKPFAFCSLALDTMYVALDSDDPKEVRDYLHQSAEASRELFHLAWPNRDNLYAAKVFGDDGSGTGPLPAIRGMHAALGALDLELARDIARHSGFKDDKRYGMKSQRLYADALRSWLLTGEYTGFAQVPPESGTVTFHAFAQIFLVAKDDPRAALTTLEELSRRFEKSRLNDIANLRLCILSLRLWLLSQV